MRAPVPWVTDGGGVARLGLAAFCALCPTGPAAACGLALALAVDISGSIDPQEYRLQMDGLADALRDDTIAEGLVRSRAAVMLLQWTGSSRQNLAIPWTRIRGFDDVEALAARVAATPRPWRNYSTAIGEALKRSHDAFDHAPACKRYVIDVSGDGESNEGVEPRAIHPELRARGITVNGLAIEGGSADITGYYFENVIVGEGAFVVTANDFSDYPDAIRRKLLREVTKQIAGIE